MKRHLLLLLTIVLVISSCSESKSESDNSYLDGTTWCVVSSGNYITNLKFEFRQSSFVFTEGEYVYNGSYSLSLPNKLITLAFKSVEPSLDVINKATTAYISTSDSTITYEGRVYKRMVNTTYSELRKKEKLLIANYISRHNFNILTEEPAEDYIWGEMDYYKVEGYDDFYFHLRHRGEAGEVMMNDMIVTRYKKFGLTEGADTISYWTTLDVPHPYEFLYGNLSSCEAESWHMAVKLMKNSDSECEIIVPSKLGFDADQMSVTPYAFIMHIFVKQ